MEAETSRSRLSFLNCDSFFSKRLTLVRNDMIFDDILAMFFSHLFSSCCYFRDVLEELFMV